MYIPGIYQLSPTPRPFPFFLVLYGDTRTDINGACCAISVHAPTSGVADCRRQVCSPV